MQGEKTNYYKNGNIKRRRLYKDGNVYGKDINYFDCIKTKQRIMMETQYVNSNGDYKQTEYYKSGNVMKTFSI